MDSVSDRSSSSLSETGCDSGRATITLRFLITSKEAGSIIGKKGDNIKKIREESGAKVNISDASSSERIVSVTGSTSQIVKVFSMITPKFEEDQPSVGHNGIGLQQGQVIFRLIAPNAHCGSLIGKGGNNIKELRETSGATIQVANEMLPNLTERIISICGSLDSIIPCIQRLIDIALEIKLKNPSIPYQPGGGSFMQYQQGMYRTRQPFGMNPYGMMHSRRPPMGPKGRNMPFADMTSFYTMQQNLMASNYTALMRSGFQGASGRGQNHHGRMQTKEIDVPNELVGSIIGRHGLKINEIRQASQAAIKIGDVVEGSATRHITIIGAPDCVDSAVYLINAVQAKYAKN